MIFWKKKPKKNRIMFFIDSVITIEKKHVYKIEFDNNRFFLCVCLSSLSVIIRLIGYRILSNNNNSHLTMNEWIFWFMKHTTRMLGKFFLNFFNKHHHSIYIKYFLLFPFIHSFSPCVCVFRKKNSTATVKFLWEFWRLHSHTKHSFILKYVYAVYVFVCVVCVCVCVWSWRVEPSQTKQRKDTKNQNKKLEIKKNQGPSNHVQWP